jgi:glutathione S-transferase
MSGWEFKPGQAGWGDYASMIQAMEGALRGRDYLLGERFSMADVIFGGTLRFMLRFNMIDATPAFTSYADRLGARPALQRADARNASVAKEHGINPG